MISSELRDCLLVLSVACLLWSGLRGILNRRAKLWSAFHTFKFVEYWGPWPVRWGEFLGRGSSLSNPWWSIHIERGRKLLRYVRLSGSPTRFCSICGKIRFWWKKKNHTTPLTASLNAYMDAITSAKRNALLCALKVKFSIFLHLNLPRCWSSGTRSLRPYKDH